MQYGVLSGGGTPKRQKKSSVRLVAGHLYSQVRRPSRFCSRLLFTVFGLMLTSALIYGRQRRVDLSRTASSIKDYIPDSITDVLGQYGDFEEQRWNDEVGPKNTTQRIIQKPKFHLLIPAKQPTENLCKTLLSAAILNYPPPTLISYGNTGKNTRPGADVVKNIFTFLHGKEAHDNDLILVVEEDAWFQLPAQVTINRFFHGLKDSNAKLLKEYGPTKDSSDARGSNRQQKFHMKVLFGASKECSNAPSDPTCYSVPDSPLPKDIYGHETDRHPEGKYNRPKYMSSSTVMGRVNDLRPIYKEASEKLELEEIGKHGSQYIFSEIFGLQEYARTHASAGDSRSKWMSLLSYVLPSPQHFSISLPNITLKADKNYEFGIGLDYFSSIFQVMNNSVEDVKFVMFNHPSVIASPSRISEKAFRNPIRLPPDLALAPPPFYQNRNSALNPDPPITELDHMHDDTALWTDIELSTNVIVPGSSVPASLNFDGSEYLLDGKMWEKMWFHPNARALMRQYIRSPGGPIAASAAAEGGDRWWDLRGGKGGVWTDRGEWLEWNEICGPFDEKVFGDNKGEFMREKEEVGGQKVVYKFGQVVQGKPPKTKPTNLDAHKDMIGDAMNGPETGSTQLGQPKDDATTLNPQVPNLGEAAIEAEKKEPLTPWILPQANPNTKQKDSSQTLKGGDHPDSEIPTSEKPMQASHNKPFQDPATTQIKPTEQELPPQPALEFGTQSKQTEQETHNHLLAGAESKLATPPSPNMPVKIEQAEGGQAMIAGLGMENAGGAGAPMNVEEDGMQVAGTMDLKLASENSFVAPWDLGGSGDGKGDGNNMGNKLEDGKQGDKEEVEKKAKDIDQVKAFVGGIGTGKK